MRKAEFWLGELINAFIRAKDLGVSEDILKEAQKEHDRAHILWEWWTAENSDGFHNPEAARQSLAQSIDASQKGIEILNKAISQKTAAK
jgi:formate-dependent nitrite reductase cytochrome c552 subunit